MRVELIGRRGAPTAKLIVKRLSGKFEKDREIFELGSSSREDARVGTLDCDEKVGFGRTPSGSAGTRTAAEAVVTEVSTVSKTIFNVIYDEDLRRLWFFSLMAYLWWDTRQRLTDIPI